MSVLAEVDIALRRLFEERMTTLRPGSAGAVAQGQVGIQPPDDAWITKIGGFTPPRGLNIYLAEVCENRKLRTNERLERTANGVVSRDRSPMRMDCHYLISAWSGAVDRGENTLTEHRVLAQALAVLVESRAITVAGAELPTTIAPPEGFPKLAEFWGTMGAKPWKPAVQLVVTIPVSHSSEVAGAPVTTRFTEYGNAADPAAAELRVQIAGVVRDRSDPSIPAIAVARAWVRLESPTGAPLATTRSDAEGRFTFLDLASGSYRLGVRADGRAEPPVTTIAVPSTSGRYDLEFH